MKTQISSLINGQKNVIRDESNPKYINAPMATSHIGYAGTNAAIRKEVAYKVLSENPTCLNIESRGKQFNLERKSTLSGKTCWYEASITADDFLLLSGRKTVPYANETDYSLRIDADMKVGIILCTRSNERAQWRYRATVYIGEEFINIL